MDRESRLCDVCTHDSIPLSMLKHLDGGVAHHTLGGYVGNTFLDSVDSGEPHVNGKPCQSRGTLAVATERSMHFLRCIEPSFSVLQRTLCICGRSTHPRPRVHGGDLQILEGGTGRRMLEAQGKSAIRTEGRDE